LADATTGHLIAHLPPISNYGNGEYGLAFSPDETLVARASEKEVTIHATATGRTIHSLGMPIWGSCAAFSPDNKLVAAGSGTMDIFNSGQLQVCDLATRRNLFPHESVRLGVWGLAFSPNGTLLAAAMGNYADRGANIGRVGVWETATWKQVLDLRGHSGCAWSVGFSASGKRLASAGAQWGQPTPMGRRTGSPPGRNWAPGEVIIWDVATGHELLRLRDEKGGVFGVAFSPDGRRLATGSQAGEVKLLDGTPLLETPPYEPLPAMN